MTLEAADTSRVHRRVENAPELRANLRDRASERK